MPLFSSKLDYALRAVVDLALQPPDIACQSREIALRQNIRGPYLDQILAVLKREGVIRSIRGAGGGYTLARTASKITIGDVVFAVNGSQLLISGDSPPVDEGACAAYIVRQYQERLEAELNKSLSSTTIAELAGDKQRLDESLSYMPSI